MDLAHNFEACCTTIIGDMAKALCERNGETPEQRIVRGQAVIHMIMGFLPRDVIEVTLASHCVMFHELMVAGVHDAFCAEEAKVRRAELHGLIAMNKAFCGNLGHLARYQKRVAEGSHEAPAESQAASGAGTVAGRAAGAESAQDPGRAEAEPVPSDPGKSSATCRPTDEAIAAGRDNAAAAAIRSGDPVGFARAMGIGRPSADFLAAARAPGSPFDLEAPGPWPEDAWLNKPKP